MEFIPADSISLICFIAILVLVSAAFIGGAYYSKYPQNSTPIARAGIVTLGLGVWLLVTVVFVKSGFMLGAMMPRLMMFFGFINLVSVVLALSPFGRWYALGIPISYLVLFQSFRLPLELVLHAWAEQGTIPDTMTWTGSNFDIVSGMVAIAAFPFAAKHRVIAWAADIVGFVLLLNVIRVAVMSSPLPFAWEVSPPLQLALYLPYAFIAPLCVGAALFGHVVMTRALLRSQGTR